MRRFAKILVRIFFVAFAVIVIGLGVYLTPAHLQIRQVEAPIPSLTVFDELMQADDKPVRVRSILTSSQQAPGRSIGHHSVAVEWSDGRIIESLSYLRLGEEGMQVAVGITGGMVVTADLHRPS